MIYIMNKKYIYTLITSLTLFFICIFATSPYRLPLLFITLPSFFAVVSVAMATRILLQLAHVSLSLSRITTTVVTCIVAVIAILVSLGQLTFKDFFLLLGLSLVAGFYISRMFRSNLPS